MDGCTERGETDAVVINKSFCVEWGALYGMKRQDRIDKIKEEGMDVGACRQKCLDNPDCARYSWKKVKTTDQNSKLRIVRET